MTSAPASSALRGDEPGWLYDGEVVHVRLTPRRHRLRYAMTALLVDVDRIGELAARHRAFGYNRFACASLHDRDYGAGDQTIAAHARAMLDANGLAQAGHRIQLLTYPRVAGYAFNPVSIYYGYDAAGDLGALMYEVNNTFGERKCYVLPAGPASPGGVHHQACAKELSVSPFTPGKGGYSFHVTAPDPAAARPLTVGIAFRTHKQPILRTHFCGRQKILTSTELVGFVLGRPWNVVKVTAAIHWEAAKLYARGVPLVRRHRSPPFSLAAGRRAEDDC
ncbi:MAG: DUF1365 domain-containing protein [Pseudomonadota bacterium]